MCARLKSFTSGCKEGSDAAVAAMLVEIMPQYKLAVSTTIDRHGQIRIFYRISKCGLQGHFELTDHVLICTDSLKE